MKQRYGNLVRGWQFRTYPELLEQAEQKAEFMGLTQTEFIEYALRLAIGSPVVDHFIIKPAPAVSGKENEMNQSDLDRIQKEKEQLYAQAWQAAQTAAHAAQQRGEPRAVVENDWAKAFAAVYYD